MYKKVNLTDEAITHLSDAIYLGNNDEIRRLKNDNKQSLYYLYFIYDQVHKRNDFAADALLKVVKQFTNRAKGDERSKRDEQRLSTLLLPNDSDFQQHLHRTDKIRESVLSGVCQLSKQAEFDIA